ncbi:MAG: sulfatase [Planctomycetota bacterium]|mgnify:FL=1|nr:MAG: sulfatase [Planctomycetota bacterium]
MNETIKLALAAGTLCWLSTACTTPAAAAEQGNQPNIVLIVADDLGYGEIVCGGKQPIPTPHIHSIARAGLCFTDAYVSCPVCSPTRAGLITGRYQQRFGHEFNTGPAARAGEKVGLPLEEVTLADRLKKLGYATGAVGKWHLGYAAKFHPHERGFDEFFGFLGGAHSYLDSEADPKNPIRRSTDPVKEPEYLTDALGREAAEFIERHKAEPFFLYLPFNATHGPLEAPPKYLKRFADIENKKRRTFAAMLAAMDDAVGTVLDALKKNQLEENTLVFFIGDNGGPTRQITSRNDPLRGFKGQVWEGGIRVPFMMQWPGHLPAGKVVHTPVIALDILPTAVAAAGGSVSGGKPIDGVDLLPYLTGEKTGQPHDALYWRFGPQWAIRRGDYKLLQTREPGLKLYNLAGDISEQQDLAGEHPDIVAKLKKHYDAWNEQLEDPRWQPPVRRRTRANRRQAVEP